MNRTFLLVCTMAFSGLYVKAQESDAKSSMETAKTFARQGDYTNAIVVLNAAIGKDPQNLELLKDLAFDYYLQKNYAKGLTLARPLTERADADVQCFQITALFYKAIDEVKECEKLYKTGIKRFPQSGVLHNEYGEMLLARQDNNAIREWEKGIEIDPNFPGNYYNASKYYFYNGERVWSLLYGEIFVNLESYSKRTAEIKEFLLESYKKIFADPDFNKDQGTKGSFRSAFLDVLKKSSAAISRGVTAESLTVLRTKFILAWFDQYATTYPFRLFEYHRQLIKEGMFDAYNQWIFGAVDNLSTFQGWTNTHSEEYNKFTNFQKGRVFKLPPGQYYQTAK